MIIGQDQTTHRTKKEICYDLISQSDKYVAYLMSSAEITTKIIILGSIARKERLFV